MTSWSSLKYWPIWESMVRDWPLIYWYMYIKVKNMLFIANTCIFKAKLKHFIWLVEHGVTYFKQIFNSLIHHVWWWNGYGTYVESYMCIPTIICEDAFFMYK